MNVQMNIRLSACVFGSKVKHKRQVVVVSGSFLSETGEAAALLWFLHEQGVHRERHEGTRSGRTYKSESLP